MKQALNKKEKIFLLRLARKTLQTYLKDRKIKYIDNKDIFFPALKKLQGSFVTLEKFGELRGCIGHILPIQPLYKDIQENAINAAIFDPRFHEVENSELKEIIIEISVLSAPKPISYKNIPDLIGKIKNKGVIISKEGKQATFLPQVWEDIKYPEDFLSHLCAKAGLMHNEWKNGTIKVETYKAEVFSEK